MSHEKKDYIAGIYNYCDRWCEKCGFTANCLLFTEESKIKTYEILHNGSSAGIEDFLKNGDLEPDDKFPETEDYNDDYESDEYWESTNDEEDDPDAGTGPKKENFEHPLLNLLDEYMDKSDSLIKSLNEKYNFFTRAKKMMEGPPAQRLYEDFEIFNWYYTFLSIKLKRAIFGLSELKEDESAELREIHEYDINGCAKIGIIAVKKSISAVNNLNKALPLYTAETGEALVLLGRILNLTEETFPGCMEFKRPGFDD